MGQSARGSGGEHAVWTRVDVGEAAPLDLFCARFTRHHFAPHTHAEFAIGVCTDGVETINYRGTRWRSGPGTLVVIEPEEPHTGGPALPAGFAYSALYPDVTLLSEGQAQPHFREPLIHDPQLAERLQQLHGLLRRGLDPLEGEARLTAMLATLVHRHAVASPRVTTGLGQIANATMARLGDQLVDPPALHQVASELGLSRFQLLRAFRDSVGMTPYAWLAQHRVARARTLLETGHRPAQAAALVGFADQAHLTRWFRRVMGVTPGAYRNSVQDTVRARP